MPLIFMTRSGSHAHLTHGVDDALGDGVVAAAGAERRFAAAIFNDRKADVVDLGAWRSCSCGCHFYRPSLVANSSVMVRASIGSPL